MEWKPIKTIEAPVDVLLDVWVINGMDPENVNLHGRIADATKQNWGGWRFRGQGESKEYPIFIPLQVTHWMYPPQPPEQEA